MRRVYSHKPFQGSPLLKSIESFRSNPGYGGDGTRIDLAYAIYALSRGVPEVEAIIGSRDLSHKGGRKAPGTVCRANTEESMCRGRREIQHRSRALTYWLGRPELAA
jgi:hypothetical protein